MVCEMKDGMLMIKKNCLELVEFGIDDLKEIILELIGEKVKSFYMDISLCIGE